MAYGAVDRKTWNDERFRSWGRDTRDVWLYLLTCPHGNRLGCFVLPVSYICEDVQLGTAEASSAMETLETCGRIVWDPVARVVCIRKHLHPDYNPLANPNVVKSAVDNDLAELPESPRCFAALLDAAKRFGEPFGKPFYQPLIEAIQERLGGPPDGGNGPSRGVDATKREKRSPATDRNRSTNRSPNGMPNQEQYQDQEQYQEQEQITTTPPTPPTADPQPDDDASSDPPEPPSSAAGKGVPPERLEPLDRTAYELVEAADKILGLGKLGVADRRANQRIVQEWLFSGDGKRDRGSIWAAIHGAAQLRDEGKIDWLPRGKPASVKVLVKACALRDQGDGKSVAPLWDLATDRYYAGEPEMPVPRGFGGPTRVQVQIAGGGA